MSKPVILSTDFPLWGDFCTEPVPVVYEGVNQDFLKNIERGYLQFVLNDFNSRGGAKQSIQHDFIRNILEPLLPEGFVIYSKTENQLVKKQYRKEYNVPMCGSYSGKNIDITIFDEKRNTPVVIINCKFPLSSQIKNEDSYKSNFGGESERLRKKNPNVGIFYCNVLLYRTPRFTKDKVLDGFDIITDRRVSEYDETVELAKENNHMDGYLYCLLDDSITKEKWIESYEKLKEYHNSENYRLTYKESSKVYNNLIYNDFGLFIKKILEYVNNYIEKTKNQAI